MGVNLWGRLIAPHTISVLIVGCNHVPSLGALDKYNLRIVPYSGFFGFRGLDVRRTEITPITTGPQLAESENHKCYRIDFEIPQKALRKLGHLRLSFLLLRKRRFWFRKRIVKSAASFRLTNKPIDTARDTTEKMNAELAALNPMPKGVNTRRDPLRNVNVSERRMDLLTLGADPSVLSQEHLQKFEVYNEQEFATLLFLLSLDITQSQRIDLLYAAHENYSIYWRCKSTRAILESINDLDHPLVKEAIAELEVLENSEDAQNPIDYMDHLLEDMKIHGRKQDREQTYKIVKRLHKLHKFFDWLD